MDITSDIVMHDDLIYRAYIKAYPLSDFVFHVQTLDVVEVEGKLKLTLIIILCI